MKISEINIYPIKSLQGCSLKKSIVENIGLQFDRRWMLVDKKNHFLTQREFPKMATLKVEVVENGLCVNVQANKIDIPFAPLQRENATVKIWSSHARAEIYEDEINDWFGDVLQTNCKLVLMPTETVRKVNYFYAIHKYDSVSFADAYPFLLIGEGSLEDLNSRLKNPVPMNRFRTNFVVSGSEPFAEDNWKKIKIGETIFHVVKPCARCVMTTIDQNSGQKQGVEPLKTLSSYRIPKRSVNKKILFGQNLIAETAGGIIKIGDKVEILEMKN